ncbi:MAG TPA: type II toxin-antitoxin system VapC family toxin [Vicinamibacterales bacterium]|nr:type II toxin-antitoxin system VapC family toxin [Vicinamibacterales bacterium]
MKYTLDTNVFIDGFHNEQAQADLLAFLNRALPFTYLSAVVMQELAAGARTAEAVRNLRVGVFEPFERRGRVFAPSAGAFVDSGRVLARVAAKEGRQVIDEDPSLLNDALIAASCREQGITVITKDSDFERIAPFLKGLRYVKPWPSAPGAKA